MKRTIRVCDRHSPQDEVRADETVTFRYGDADYEIDLCVEHADEYRAFETQQKEWVGIARIVTAEPRDDSQSRRRPSHGQRLENTALRQWAQSQGIDLGQRGRIPEELRERYRNEVGEDARRRWTESAQQHDGAQVKV